MKLFSDDVIESLVLLDLTVDSYNRLKRSGINTISELIKLTDSELRSIKNLEFKDYNNIKRVLKRYNDVSLTKSDTSILCRLIVEMLLYGIKNVNISLLDENELDTVKSIQIAIDELGYDFCEYAYCNSKKISLLIDAFTDYAIKYAIIPYINDLSEFIDGIFKVVYKTSQIQRTIELRCTGLSLATVGKEIGVTPERVRQIEKKAFRIFNDLNAKKRIFSRLCAVKGEDFITNDELIALIPNKKYELLYLLKKIKSNQYVYDEELNVFTYGETDYKPFIDEAIRAMPEDFFLDELSDIIEIYAKKYKIHVKLLEIAIKKYYKQEGNIFYKSRMLLEDIYGYVLWKYYPRGIKVYDELELEKFRKIIYKDFGDIEIHQGNRTLISRIVDIGVLCDRGTYLHKNNIYIKEELLQKIDDFIKNNERSTLTYLEIYEIFKEELLPNSSVDNYYYLQGVIRFFFQNEYSFSRSCLSKWGRRIRT